MRLDNVRLLWVYSLLMRIFIDRKCVNLKYYFYKVHVYNNIVAMRTVMKRTEVVSLKEME